MKTVPQLLREAADIYEQRNAIYGDNYKKFGAWVGPLLRGAGVVLETDDDWGRMAYRILMLHKISRDLMQFNNGGHPDSLDDLSVYAMMVRELDEEARQTNLVDVKKVK